MIAALFLCLCSARDQTFSFAGGQAFDLAGSIGMVTGKPTIALVYKDQAYEKFSIDQRYVSSPKDFKRLLRSKGSILASIGSVIALSGEVLPLEAYNDPSRGGWSPSQTVQEVKPLDPTALVNGRIQLKSKANESFSVDALTTLKWQKPLQCHWLFRNLRLAANISSATEKDFLVATAACIGAKFIETPKTFEFEFDPSLFRPRAVATIQAFRPRKDPVLGDAWTESSLKMSAAAFEFAPDDVLTKLYTKPNSARAYPAPKVEQLYIAINGRVQAIRAFKPSKDPSVAQAASVYQGNINNIDWSITPTISLMQNLSGGLAFRAKTGGSILL